MAAHCGNTDIIDYLILKNADINAVTQGNETPVMKACMASCEDIMKKFLFVYKCSITIKNFQGKSIFDVIAEHMSREKFNYYMKKLKNIYPNLNFDEFGKPNDLLTQIHYYIQTIKNNSPNKGFAETINKLVALRESQSSNGGFSPNITINLDEMCDEKDNITLSQINMSDEGLNNLKHSTTNVELENSIVIHKLSNLENTPKKSEAQNPIKLKAYVPNTFRHINKKVDIEKEVQNIENTSNKMKNKFKPNFHCNKGTKTPLKTFSKNSIMSH